MQRPNATTNKTPTMVIQTRRQHWKFPFYQRFHSIPILKLLIKLLIRFWLEILAPQKHPLLQGIKTLTYFKKVNKKE